MLIQEIVNQNDIPVEHEFIEKNIYLLDKGDISNGSLS
jgi:hypothetical protein